TSPDNMRILWIGIASLILVSTGIVVGYIKIFGVKKSVPPTTSIIEGAQEDDLPVDSTLI
ncbi:MAG: hypothetical protein WBB58_02165, partial [Microgenomates group bacterium]